MFASEKARLKEPHKLHGGRRARVRPALTSRGTTLRATLLSCLALLWSGLSLCRCSTPPDTAGDNGNGGAADFEDGLFRYLDAQQDPVTGLLASYTNRGGLPQVFVNWLTDNEPAFVYDNALAALAYLCRAQDHDLDRARQTLDAFLAIQNAATGGLPDAVHAETMAPVATDYGTGNQMWAVLALLKGYHVLGDARYLDAAVRIGEFVLHQKNTAGYGGFVLFPGSTIVGTEHNVDAYAGFSQLAREMTVHGRSADAAKFEAAAAHARIFVESRFDEVTGKTFTGTDETGVATNRSPVPEDTQTWTLLALGRMKWRRSYDWLLGRDGLWARSTTCPTLAGVEIRGPSFSDADVSEVWFEGLAHAWLAAKLLTDATTPAIAASPPEQTLRTVQTGAPGADGRGIVATCDTLETGFGADFKYYNALHVGATAWAILANRGYNPFWDGPVTGSLQDHPASSIPWVALETPQAATFHCRAGNPCSFTVSGASSGVAGQSDRAIYVLIRPTDPSAGATFIQLPAATVQPDGAWTASAAVGSREYPAQSGDRFEVSAIVVNEHVDPAHFIVQAVTPQTIPGLLTVSGILEATAQVEP